MKRRAFLKTSLLGLGILLISPKGLKNLFTPKTPQIKNFYGDSIVVPDDVPTLNEAIKHIGAGGTIFIKPNYKLREITVPIDKSGIRLVGLSININ